MTPDIKVQRFETRPIVEAYAEEVLRKNLAWGEGRLQIDIPEDGSRSLVFFVRAEGSPAVAVQAFRDTDERAKLARALRYANKEDAPVPKLLRCGTAFLERRRFQMCFLTMEYVEGKSLKPGAPDSYVRDALASALARLHGIRSNKWGKPGKTTRKSIREDWYGSAIKRMEELRGGIEQLGNNMTELLENWFARKIASIPEPEEFQLCHHHLARDDMIYHADQGLKFIDCASLQLSRAARDLASLRNTVFRDEESPWIDFQERYYGHFSKERRAECERELPLFDALFHLGKLRRRIVDDPRMQESLDRLIKATETKIES